MIMSVSILMIGSGAATPVSCVNLSMAGPLCGAWQEKWLPLLRFTRRPRVGVGNGADGAGNQAWGRAEAFGRHGSLGFEGRSLPLGRRAAAARRGLDAGSPQPLRHVASPLRS